METPEHQSAQQRPLLLSSSPVLAYAMPSGRLEAQRVPHSQRWGTVAASWSTAALIVLWSRVELALFKDITAFPTQTLDMQRESFLYFAIIPQTIGALVLFGLIGLAMVLSLRQRKYFRTAREDCRMLIVNHLVAFSVTMLLLIWFEGMMW